LHLAPKWALNHHLFTHQRIIIKYQATFTGHCYSYYSQHYYYFGLNAGQ